MSKVRRSDVTTEVVVGAFMFIALLVLATFTIVISQNKLFEKAYNYTVRFPDVAGLKDGENVFMRGVKVGTVDRILVPEDTRETGVDVVMRLTRKLTLYEGYEIKIDISSMLGGLRVNIYEGPSTAPRIAEDAQLVGTPIFSLMDEAADTVALLKKALEEDGILEDVKNVTSNLSLVAQNINRGTGTVARLINEDAIYANADAFLVSLQGTVSNINAMIADVKVVTDRIAAGQGTLGRLLSEDDAVYRDLEATVANIREASEDAKTLLARLDSGEGTIGKLLSADDQVYQDLRDTVASLKKFSGELAEQEGTISRLIKEDTLYTKVEELVDEARATIDDFRETSPITTFSSIFFGAF